MPIADSAPKFSMGDRFDDKRDPPGTRKTLDGKPSKSRFDSKIRSKPHLHPKKSDDPGPGSHAISSGIKNGKNNPVILSDQTLIGGKRWSNLKEIAMQKDYK